MKTTFLNTAILLALAAPTFAALQAGEMAPPIETSASLAGKEFHYSLQAALKNGTVVVYFYPSAFTQGCNVQAHTFSQRMDKFTAAGASVIGVSLDNITRLNGFSKDPDYCAGKLAVASDQDGKIAKSFDLQIAAANASFKDTRGVEIGHGFAERTTFIVTTDGKIAATIGGLAPAENVQKALQAVQAQNSK